MSQDTPKKIVLISNADDQPKKQEREASEAQSNALTLTEEDLRFVTTGKDFLKLLEGKNLDAEKIIETIHYERDLKKLQIELIRLQRDVVQNNRRVAILFEGRDAAGKGGTIRRFTQHLNPRNMNVVALNKPNETQKGQWYFQRYVENLPSPGNITFFDRSWYNRAVVEPVMGFCTQQEHEVFMRQVSEFEHMLYEDGVEIIKFWFSISKQEQERRFSSRRVNPLKQWKMSPVDERAQELWEQYSQFKNEMFAKTHTSFSPWVIIRANNKKKARLESMRYTLSRLPYEGKENACIGLDVDPNYVSRYHRLNDNLD